MRFEKSKPEMYVDMGYKKEAELETDKLEIITIELPKFKQQNPNVENKLNQWLWLIIGEEERIKMAIKKNEKIEKAVEIIDQMSMDPKEWELYRSRQMAIMNYNISMSNSEKKGEKIGEKKAKEEIARKMINKGTKLEEIIEITGLTKEEIDTITKKEKQK
jgi:predicted transposase/invertase (TIGR01784 family)